ncbi:hypothetical protein [Microbacterium oleivorans]|uniref:hypothetical protein n=1 Tax=Microbacterium oleivorans TaxID=273677 RepID=UPI001CB8B10F|nr:hypothetical protein [Microbacterium oleivorans]
MPQSSSACSGGGWVTTCETSNNGSSVSIGATRGESSSPDRPQSGPRGGGSSIAPPPPPNPDAVYPGGRTRDEWLAECAFNQACAGASVAPGGAPIPGTEQAELPPAEPDAPVAPDPTTATIQDVAEFAPAPPPIVGEPDGMGVVGMPTNFVVGAEQHVVRGEIFDIPVTVRFTPVSYAFAYGDGAVRETRTAGTSWEDLGVPQFTATDTSHSYDAAGEYQAGATIRYAAEADAGGGWFPIAGLLQIDTPTTVIRIVDVETALVQRTCDEDPGGPGC